MIKSDWNVFKAKFSDNPQNYFEWFSYLLFCREFNLQYGIFRYKNQSAIETNPIIKNDEVIGWQAKFYDVTLSKRENEIIKSIEKTKRDYPNLSKLFFYTNQEWGQNKGAPPKGKINIEKIAKDNNIELIWRTASYFESEFVSIENECISKEFFSYENSYFDIIEQLRLHSESILAEINTKFIFNGNNFEISRNTLLDKLRDESKKVVIIRGVGGVGKTVIIKKFFIETNYEIPLFIFKASEFELRSINDLFRDFSFFEFCKTFKQEKNKIIVIDSSEKLLDLKNSDPFKEFLSTLINDGWRFIFTTRDNYYEDLCFQFFNVYYKIPESISISNIHLEELQSLSEKYNFKLPVDEKLLQLIRNPFYLNEYLRNFEDTDDLNYFEFKSKLWNQIIKKSKPERESLFLRIAFNRANSGHFYINVKSENESSLKPLVDDGILGYETAGYFITHDLYEEWALEKNIEREFYQKEDLRDFYKKIGESLPIRRCFRNWISDGLAKENKEIKDFILDTYTNLKNNQIWKDEIFVSVLLSEYSQNFINLIKNDLLTNDQELLKRQIFLLRIACKEIDEDNVRLLNSKNPSMLSLEHVFTRPKGTGWETLVKFVYENIQEIGIENVGFIIPILYDWSSKTKNGITTKLSGLIALQYYEWIESSDVYLSEDRKKENIIQTIMFCSSEIKNELQKILIQVVENKWKFHRNPYYDLSKTILSELSGVAVARVLPNETLKLAELFWTRTIQEDFPFYSGGIGIEEYFNLDDDHLDYFPASAYRTPVYWLLDVAFKETVDFILQFTNKSIESFAKSEIGIKEIEVIEISINESKVNNQYICDRLWSFYRGMNVGPSVLQSVHMALEKFLLEIARFSEPMILHSWLRYLLINSNSASISAIVVSIVLAYPEKLFDIAKILFSTKAFFEYETARYVKDLSHKTELQTYKKYFGFNFANEVYENERIDTCDESHRMKNLETQFLEYQIRQFDNDSEEEINRRQDILWNILDDYYSELPNATQQTESEKTWRLCLARMDRRNMSMSTEETENGYAILFTPEIDEKLKEFSEESLAKTSEPMVFSSLKNWANLKFINDESYKKYSDYNEDPHFVVKKTKELVAALENFQATITADKDVFFYRFNVSIPAYVCAVLIRDYDGLLSDEEILFCKETIMSFATLSICPNYQYQISDGVEPALTILPKLLDIFPDEALNIKFILLCTLFLDFPVHSVEKFSIFPIVAILNIWKQNYEEAQSIMLGFLYLKPKYDELRAKINNERYENRLKEFDNKYFHNRFFEENEKSIEKVLTNQLKIDDIGDLRNLRLDVLLTAFHLIFQETDNKENMEIAYTIINIFMYNITQNKTRKKVDYVIRHKFLQIYASLLLKINQNEIEHFLQPIIKNFSPTDDIADLFQEIILEQDKVKEYDKFWVIWNLFRDKIIEVNKDGDLSHNRKKVIMSYLFAQSPWKDDVREWHTITEDNIDFFNDVSKHLSHCTSVLYSISKFLYNIGSNHLDIGIFWISDMIQSNNKYTDLTLEKNTVYYIEKLVRKYIYINREEIRKSKVVKEKIVRILDFLVENESVVGYMLRENII